MYHIAVKIVENPQYFSLSESHKQKFAWIDPNLTLTTEKQLFYDVLLKALENRTSYYQIRHWVKSKKDFLKFQSLILKGLKCEYLQKSSPLVTVLCEELRNYTICMIPKKINKSLDDYILSNFE